MKYILYILIILCISIISCKKDFLDAKPDIALVVPQTLDDFQGLLDNNSNMNLVPNLSLVSTDDVYTTDAGYTGASVAIKNSYLWEKDIYQGTPAFGWNVPYVQVFDANIVLDGLVNSNQNIKKQNRWKELKGSALFYRANAFFNVSQEFAAPYNITTASQILGIPIRLNSDVLEKSKRGTLKQTFDQIISDLNEALPLLPEETTVISRPTKSAANALLARIYLIMGKYEDAIQAASNCLIIHNDLIDYNTLNPLSARPFPYVYSNANKEVLFFSALIPVSFIYNPSTLSIDSLLYNSYDNNDLRKSLFFNRNAAKLTLFKGTYTGAFSAFAGLATDEVLLTRAECYARFGKTAEAMSDLNTLLYTRWKTGTYINYTAANADEALQIILIERRKELVYRNLRWTDLKRLNQDDRFKITLRRKIAGKDYILQPGDPKYAFPIPDDEIRNSGIEQNPR